MHAANLHQHTLSTLEQLIQQGRRHDRQWVHALKRIQYWVGLRDYASAQTAWRQLLQPVRGSFHEFFIYCADLDQMRELNRQLDDARQELSLALEQLCSGPDPRISAVSTAS